MEGILSFLDRYWVGLVIFSGYLEGLRRKNMTRRQLRWLLLMAMGVFFASSAVIPSMGILLRQITGLLLP